MKREEKSQQVRQKIIDTSRRLFISQGYAATTIRQILGETGLTTGTLYHFYQNKEDILMQIVADYLDDTNRALTALLENHDDPVVRYALIITLQIKAAEKYERIAELYLHAYELWSVSEIICKNSAVRNREFFSRYNKGMNEDDWYTLSLAINGVIRNCIAERLHGGRIPFENRVRVILTAAFTYFNVPKNKISPAIEEAGRILKSRRFSLYGMNI